MAREENLWLSYAGVRSEAAGVRVLRLPAPPAAAPRGALVEIPGRDGALWQSDGGSATVELKALMRLNAGVSREDVASWLSGEGRLILSDCPGRCWRARIIKAVSFQRDGYGPGSWSAEATFTCQPFQYLVEEAPLEFADAAVFPGRGTVYSQPAITVYGSGEISLMVNDATVLLTDVEDSITVDCEIMMGLKDGANCSGKLTLLGGGDDEWPRLLPAGGTNRINWTGSVSRVAVQPRWRWR